MRSFRKITIAAAVAACAAGGMAAGSAATEQSDGPAEAAPPVEEVDRAVASCLDENEVPYVVRAGDGDSVGFGPRDRETAAAFTAGMERCDAEVSPGGGAGPSASDRAMARLYVDDLTRCLDGRGYAIETTETESGAFEHRADPEVMASDGFRAAMDACSAEAGEQSEARWASRAGEPTG